MTKYRLKVKQTQTVYFVIEAPSEEEAQELFENQMVDREQCYAGDVGDEWDSEEVVNIEEWE